MKIGHKPYTNNIINGTLCSSHLPRQVAFHEVSVHGARHVQ